MNLEVEPQTISQWISGAWAAWTLTLVALAALVVLYGLILRSAQYGLSKGCERLVADVIESARDVGCISPRRVFALARLVVHESLRRRALAGLVVFVLILAFALWFLDPGRIDPARLYFSFVLTATSYLVIGLVAVLAALGLPADIRGRTITTVVTKPVRPSEIVLGRMLGVAAIGTGLLAITGAASYVFVLRALDHTHEIPPGSLAASEASAPPGRESRLRGRTSTARGHFHEVIEQTDGTLATLEKQGHWHPVAVEQAADRPHYRVGSPRGQFHARVPVYGKLQFLDRSGHPAPKGENVGYEWTYRSYIEGGTLAAGIWTFDGLREEQFPDGLRIDLNIRVFRTYSGDVEKGIAGTLVLRNPRHRGVISTPINFLAKEFAIDRHLVPRQLVDSSGKPIELFQDLVSDGQLEIQLQCVPARQFFGMAQPDLYLMPREASVLANYLKTLAGVWLQMVVVAAGGVMFSTFLNGAVALLATGATMLMGFLHDFVVRIAENRIYGGGAFESMIRILQHAGSGQPLSDTLELQVARKAADPAVRLVMHVVARLAPDFDSLSNVAFLVDGFDVPLDRLAVQGLSALGFVVPVFLLGMVFFKFREVAL